jgi:uncharacterized RDD family membrane protein YckC
MKLLHLMSKFTSDTFEVGGRYCAGCKIIFWALFSVLLYNQACFTKFNLTRPALNFFLWLHKNHFDLMLFRMSQSVMIIVLFTFGFTLALFRMTGINISHYEYTCV